MFPLGRPLMPYTLLPLTIFEPRYLQMIGECVADDEPFGVVLIERGLEVGGHDVRASSGTVAQIVQHSEQEDGRQAVVAVGTRRIEISEWLPEDPYPQALVDIVVESACTSDPSEIERVDRKVRAVLSLLSETGIDVGPIDYVLSDDPSVAIFQLCGLAPVGAFDAQRLLTAPDCEARLGLVSDMIDEQREIIVAQLGA